MKENNVVYVPVNYDDEIAIDFNSENAYKAGWVSSPNGWLKPIIANEALPKHEGVSAEEILNKKLTDELGSLGIYAMGSSGRIAVLAAMEEYALQAYTSKDEWVSVEDYPLFTKDEKGFWECTVNGDGQFLAAVPYNSYGDEKDKWWIRQCVIEDTTGLCVMGDDENEPAGWDMGDITHYKKITPPQSK